MAVKDKIERQQRPLRGEWIGPGGLRGLQIRWWVPFGVHGGFDSHPLPPASYLKGLRKPPTTYCQFANSQIDPIVLSVPLPAYHRF